MGDIKNVNKIINPEDPMYGKVEELGVVAKDDHTLEITLENAVPYFVGLTSFATFYPQNQKFVESQGDKYALEANTLVYNGPFVLSEWKHEESWKMVKNDQYWDKDNVKLDEINVNVVKDTGTDLNLYNTNQNDLVGLSSEYVDQYKDNPDFKTETEATMWYLKMNQKNPVFKNVNVRKAFSQAIDKESMVKVILNNGSVAANYLVPANFTNIDGEDFRAKYKDGFHAFDAAKAKSDWEAGLKELKKDKVSVEFLVGDTEASVKLATYIAAQLEKSLPGLKVTLNPQPFKNRLDLENKGQYDFELAGWGPDYQDSMTFLDMFVTDGGHNRMEYSNKKYDDLIKSSKTDLSDLKKRWENLQEAERILLEEDAAIAPLYQRGRALLVKPYVKDVFKHGFGADYSYKWAYIEGKQ
jgi:oligopeptide transport system substrate-binding protein